MDPESTPSEPKDPQQYNSYLKYGGFAFQLLAAIGIAAWLGYKLDLYLALKFPAFLMTFSMLAFAGMLYMAYRNLRKD